MTHGRQDVTKLAFDRGLSCSQLQVREERMPSDRGRDDRTTEV